MQTSSTALALSLALALCACDDDRRMVGSDGGVGPTTDANLLPGVDGGPGGTDGGVTGPTSPLVDPNCVDGMFSEALPDPTVDISDLVAGYSSADPNVFIDAALMRRYTSGYQMVVNGRTPNDCVGIFLRDTSTASAIIRQLSTVVHECGHFYDNELGGFSSSVYYINDAPVQLSCGMGDTTSRGGLTFARSRIRSDAFSAGRMPCDGGSGGCDFYADIYLDGDPDDATFDGGDQGFNSVLEETVQYVNSLATAYAFTDERNTGGSVSERDGLLTFLWYVTRYLNMARLELPSAYEHLLNGGGGCWRDAILTVWGRAWLYLEATEGMGHLGIDDAALMELVMNPELLGEIQRLRDAAGCLAP